MDKSKIQILNSQIIRLWPWLAAIVSGVALALGFPPWNQSWLVWIALGPVIAALWFAPLCRPKAISGNRRSYPKAGPPRESVPFVAMEKKSRVRRALFRLALGYLTGLAYFWTVFAWITTVTLAGWIALPFYLALFVAPWAWIVGEVGDREFLRQASEKVVTQRKLDTTPTFLKSRHNLLSALLCAAAWTGLEWLRGWLFTGFGWNNIGVILHETIPLIQIVDITGVGGLSFVIVLANAIAVITVRRVLAEVGRVRLRPHWDFSATMALIVVMFAYGIHSLRTHEETTPLHFAAIQANIPQNEKWDDDFARSIYQRYHDLTLTAQALQPQLLVWPEAATPDSIFASQDSFDFVKNLAAQGPGDFLLGTLDLDTPQGDFNAAVLLKDRGTRHEIYHKMHLVPFGEYVPFRHSFPLFAWIIGDLVPSDFNAGRDPTVFTLSNGMRVAPLICFEDTVGRLDRRFVVNGAQMLVTITNDGWFGKSAESEQHLANAIFRAVENRRPLLRCANTGVTCSIDEYGNLRQTLLGADGTTFTQGILAGIIDVPVHPRLTFYSQHGEWFSVACGALALIFAGTRFRRR
jgi:apolipoprotein N-acyltransferase